MDPHKFRNSFPYFRGIGFLDNKRREIHSAYPYCPHTIIEIPQKNPTLVHSASMPRSPSLPTLVYPTPNTQQPLPVGHKPTINFKLLKDERQRWIANHFLLIAEPAAVQLRYKSTRATTMNIFRDSIICKCDTFAL